MTSKVVEHVLRRISPIERRYAIGQAPNKHGTMLGGHFLDERIVRPSEGSVTAGLGVLQPSDRQEHRRFRASRSMNAVFAALAVPALSSGRTAIAKAHSKFIAQVALRWLLQQPIVAAVPRAPMGHGDGGLKPAQA